MATEWFECKVRYDKPLDSEGLKTKQTTDSYLVDALSFTEAEKRIVEEVTPFMTGEFIVADIKRIKISELFESEDTQADKWYKAKVAFITLDEKSEQEKLTNHYMFIQATDFKNALQQLDRNMSGNTASYKIVSITETPILDVYHYETAED